MGTLSRFELEPELEPLPEALLLPAVEELLLLLLLVVVSAVTLFLDVSVDTVMVVDFALLSAIASLGVHLKSDSLAFYSKDADIDIF